MTNEKQIDVEKLAKFVKETPTEVLEKLIVEAVPENMYKLCMETLKERDCDLKLTGNYKKCYDYLAEQFTRNYLVGKSISTVLEDTAGKFYNTWRVFLGIVEHFVKDGRKFGGIEDIVNNSRISRKTWVKFLDYYFSWR